MSRLGMVAVAAAAMAVALAGCSAMPDWMTPDFMSSKPAAPALQTLRFESSPPGADVRTAQGQTCLTPCALAVPAEVQSLTITKVGFVPQTVQVSLGQPPEHSFWENPPPALVPNPVQVMLQAIPPPMRPKKPPRRSARTTRTAAKGTVRGAVVAPGTPVPPQASPFPPPPPTR